MSFSSGEDLGGDRTLVSLLEICLIFDIDFDCQNLEKAMVLGGQNGSKNRIFRALEGIGFRP